MRLRRIGVGSVRRPLSTTRKAKHLGPKRAFEHRYLDRHSPDIQDYAEVTWLNSKTPAHSIGAQSTKKLERFNPATRMAGATPMTL